jgi:hypothetical protein
VPSTEWKATRSLYPKASTHLHSPGNVYQFCNFCGMEDSRTKRKSSPGSRLEASLRDAEEQPLRTNSLDRRPQLIRIITDNIVYIGLLRLIITIMNNGQSIQSIIYAAYCLCCIHRLQLIRANQLSYRLALFRSFKAC